MLFRTWKEQEQSIELRFRVYENFKIFMVKRMQWWAPSRVIATSNYIYLSSSSSLTMNLDHVTSSNRYEKIRIYADYRLTNVWCGLTMKTHELQKIIMTLQSNDLLSTLVRNKCERLCKNALEVLYVRISLRFLLNLLFGWLFIELNPDPN